MKNFKVLCLLFSILILFQSCNKDEEVSEPTLIGVWNVNEVKTDLTVNGTLLSVFLRFEADYNVIEARSLEDQYKSSIASVFEGKTIEFKADNTFQGKIPNKNKTSGTWVVNSDNTIITFDAGTENETEIVINNLESNSFMFSGIEERMIDFTKNGTDEKLMAELQISLSK